MPIFPLHTWLPDAHVEAPTGGSVILAGVLLKMGTYGFLRFALPLFPLAALEAAPYLVALAVIGIVYGALVATVQPDLKKLVAYSSVSHLGFVMLGLFAFNPIAVGGSLYQMLNHGLSTGALFLLVGMIYERRHTRLIASFGGLWAAVPKFARLPADRDVRLGGTPRSERLRRRVPHHARRLRAVAVGDGSRVERRRPRCRSISSGCTSASCSGRSCTRRIAI